MKFDKEEKEIHEEEYSRDEDDGLLDSDDFNDDLGIGDIGEGLSPMEKHNDLLMQLTDFTPSLKEMVHGWLGLVYSEKDNGFIQVNKPVMNEDCAAWCITFLKNYTKRTNLITNIGANEYKFIMKDCIKTLWYNIGSRADLDFGIKSNGDIFRVCTEIEHSIALVLMGAGDGKYTEFFSTTTNRNENIQQSSGVQMPQVPQMVERPTFTQKVKKMLGGF